MPYSISKIQRSPQPALVIRRRVTRAGIANAITEVLPHVFRFAAQNKVEVTGPPLCRYIEMGPDLMTIEPGIPVAAEVDVPADSEIEAATLAGGTLATTVHVGPYDQLPNAVAAIREWIEREGLTPAPGLWESYVTDPGQSPDPKHWRTEIYAPLAV